MITEWIYFFNIKCILFIQLFTFYLIVFAIKDKATPEKTETIPPPYFSASYLHSFYKLEKALSQTIQAI